MKDQAIQEIIDAYQSLMRKSFETSQQLMHPKMPTEVLAFMQATRDGVTILIDHMRWLESFPDALTESVNAPISDIEIQLQKKWEELQNASELP